MPAWRQELHRAAKAEGHKLSPIVRTTLRTKHDTLAEQSNSYATACYHCMLRIEAHTYPRIRVLLMYRLGDRALPKEAELPYCSPKRTTEARIRAAYAQRQAMQEVTLQHRIEEQEAPNA